MSLKIGGFSVLCSLELIWVKKWKNLGKFWKLQGISFPMNTKLSLFCSKIAEKLEFKVTYSLQKEKKLKFGQLHTNYSFAFRTLLILKSHLKTSQAYFIKWTTSGEPPVGLKSLQDSKWSHSEVILYIAHWLPPCIIHNVNHLQSIFTNC